MVKQILTNIKLWLLYIWRIIENYYFNLNSAQRKYALYGAIGVGLIILLLIIVLVVILSQKKKKTAEHVQAAPVHLDKESSQVLTVSEEEKIQEEPVIETLEEEIKEITEEEKEILELEDENTTELPIQHETGDEDDIILTETETPQTSIIQDEQGDFQPPVDKKDEFIKKVKDDLEAEFINLIKRYFPQKINFKEHPVIEEEVSIKCKNIIEKLSTLEDPHNATQFSKHYYIAKSLFYFSISDYENLKQNIIHATNIFPNEDIFLLQYAEFLYYNNEIEQAKKQLIKIKEINPANLDMYLFLGKIYMTENKSHDALNIFKKVILIDSKNSLAYAYKGILLAKQGYISDGKKDLKKAISLDYKNYISYYFLGNIYKDLSFFGKAVALYQKSIKFGCHFLDLYENLAFCYYKLKKYNIARKKLIPYYKEDQLSVKGLEILSDCLSALDDNQKAIEVLNKALSQSEEKNLYYKIAQLFEKNNQFEKSIEYLQKASTDDNYVDTHLQIADIYYLKMKTPTEAEKYYQLVLEKESNNYHAIHNLGNIYYSTNNYEKCIQYYQLTVEHLNFKLAPDIYYKAGIAYTRIDRFGEAIKFLTKAENTGYVDEELFKALGFAYIKENKTHKAIESYEKAIAINPHNPVLHNNLGVIYAEKGEYNQAINQFKQALKNDKENKEALHNLHKAYKILSEKESEEYLSQLEEVI